jgi:hypothetical protein
MGGEVAGEERSESERSRRWKMLLHRGIPWRWKREAEASGSKSEKKAAPMGCRLRKREEGLEKEANGHLHQESCCKPSRAVIVLLRI